MNGIVFYEKNLNYFCQSFNSRLRVGIEIHSFFFFSSHRRKYKTVLGGAGSAKESMIDAIYRTSPHYFQRGVELNA